MLHRISRLTPRSSSAKLGYGASRPAWIRANPFSGSALAAHSKDLSKLKVNEDRLWENIHHTCQSGKGERWGDGETDTGMSRLSLSDADKEARDWFTATTRELGCSVSIDVMGNMFAVRPGRQAGPPTCAGSHLDTQPSGGRYDGILGVCAGVEMLRVLKEEKIETEFPVGVINWTNEEGARFPISMIASGVWAGTTPLETAHSLKEVGEGQRTMKQELERIGYLGEMEASYEAMPIDAHFELHIEQGPHLESTSQKIGIVTGVQAYRWHTLTVHGAPTHTGTTSFPHRADALLLTAKLLLASHRIAASHSALASTGILSLTPGSVNTVPGKVVFSLDIRAKEDEVLERVEREMRGEFERLARGGELVEGVELGLVRGREERVEWRLDAPSRAVRFDEGAVGCVEGAAGDLFGERVGVLTSLMVSGAGHDSVHTSKRCPTAMIFVPCRDGVSHNPREYCAIEDCANGAQVLMGSVLRWDALRGERAK